MGCKSILTIPLFKINKLINLLPVLFFLADTMLAIKTEYKINKGWTGDPCAPINYTWVGVGCDYTDNSSKIISL